MIWFKYYFDLFEFWNFKYLEINVGFGKNFINNKDGIYILFINVC